MFRQCGAVGTSGKTKRFSDRFFVLFSSKARASKFPVRKHFLYSVLLLLILFVSFCCTLTFRDFLCTLNLIHENGCLQMCKVFGFQYYMPREPACWKEPCSSPQHLTVLDKAPGSLVLCTGGKSIYLKISFNEL